MAFEVTLTAREQRLLDEARRFVAEEVAPQAAEWERRRVYPRETLGKAAALGFAGLLAPQGRGGLGVSMTATARILEELATGCMAFTFALTVHANLVANIARNGSERQRAALLPDLLAGRRIGAFLLTEPGMGSDAQAVACRAVPDGDGWRLNGEKAWISNAAGADVLSVYAQAEPEIGWRGIMCFLVEADREGVTRLEPYALAGSHPLGTGGFRFEDVRLRPGDVLLAKEAAFRAAMGGIDTARIFVGALSVGMMRDALERALAYTATRPAFGQKVADFQGVQWLLADVATDLEASRLLTYAAAAAVDEGREATMAAAHAKKFATRAALRRIADCMQAMGANGYRLDEPVARHFANAKMAQYIDGTTEIQNVVIARGLRRSAET